MKYLLYLILLFCSLPLFAQIGPLPCGAISSITTWRQDFPYQIGQVVIFNGVTYQSLTNANLNQNPCTYSGTQWSNIVGTGGGQVYNIANYTTLGLAPSGKAYVVPSQITGSITDAWLAIRAAADTLPSTGGTIDATGLGSATYTVTSQLTALNIPGKPVTLLLNSGTTFLINTSFTTPTNSPASCAVPVGPGNDASVGSAIVVPGYNSFAGNFLVGPSARVWDVVCNGDFTGNQETLRLDGVVVQGNSSATVMGSLIHLSGVFVPTRITNSGTYQCFAQCLRLDAGTTGTGGSSIGDLVFDNDHFSDTYGTGGTYPGSVVIMDAINSQGGLGNINFYGGMIEGNGPHNPLLVINGRGSVQASSIGFFGTTFQTAAATTSVSNPNVDPIQLIDVSQVYFSNLRVAGNINAAQANLVDISATISNISYGINIDQVTAFTGNFTCLIHNTADSPATCESGYPTGKGDTTLPNYTYGQVIPIMRLTNYAPSGSCINSSIWGNSAGTTAANTNFQCINGTWTGFSSGGGGGTPGGSNTQIQFNNSGVFGADATFAFNNSSKTLFAQEINVADTLTIAGTGPGVIKSAAFSAAGTPISTLPCNSTNVNTQAIVSDALSPTSMGAYVSGGQITVPVVCSYNGTSYAWLTVGGAAGGAPGGSNQAVQFNNSSAFGGDSVFTYNSGTHTLAYPNGVILPLGTATSGNNYGSGNWQLQDSYWGTSGLSFGFLGLATSPVNNSTNPPMLAEHTYSGSPGGMTEQWNYPAIFSKGSLTGIVDAQFFGAYGDAYQPPNGCSAVASNTTVYCPDGPFTSTSADAGKHVWISGMGASGVAYNGTIVTVTDSQHVVVSVAPVGTGSNVHAIVGHDDTTAVQACFQYSATNAVQCVLKAAPPIGQGLTGFLIGSGSLQLVSNNPTFENSGENVTGNGPVSGTSLFCEFNGDCIVTATGAIQGVKLSNLSINEDPTQPNSRAIHLIPSGGPFTNAIFDNIVVYNPSQECLLSEGGGGPGYGFNLPVQFVDFRKFDCFYQSSSSHPANGIKMTGQHAQIAFYSGGVHGPATIANAPNALLNIQEKTSGLSDTPDDVKFFAFTVEEGTVGISIGEGASNIHWDNGYIEDVTTPLTVTGNVGTSTFNGNHIAGTTSSAALTFGADETFSVRDNYVYGVLPTAFATCSGVDTIDFQNNVVQSSGIPQPIITTGCAELTGFTPSSTLLQPWGNIATVTSFGTPISTITAGSVNPGNTFTVQAPSGLQFVSGGNITFGAISSPLTIPSGGYVIFTLLDGGNWLITGLPPGAVTAGNSTITVSGNAVSVNQGFNFVWTGQHYFSSNSGSAPTQMGPGTTPGSSYSCFYDDGNGHWDGTCSGTNRGLFFKGLYGGNIAYFQDPSGANQFSIGSTGALNIATARKGTFTCTAGGTITITNALEQNTSDVIISLNAQAGTISTAPAMKTVTGGTGFTVLCGAADTSLYNYDILN